MFKKMILILLLTSELSANDIKVGYNVKFTKNKYFCKTIKDLEEMFFQLQLRGTFTEISKKLFISKKCFFTSEGNKLEQLNSLPFIVVDKVQLSKTFSNLSENFERNYYHLKLKALDNYIWVTYSPRHSIFKTIIKKD